MTIWTFLLRMARNRSFWMLLLANLTAFLMWAWRSALRDEIFQVIDEGIRRFPKRRF